MKKNVKSNNNGENLSWSNIENSIFSDVDLNFKGGEDWIRYRSLMFLAHYNS